MSKEKSIIHKAKLKVVRGSIAHLCLEEMGIEFRIFRTQISVILTGDEFLQLQEKIKEKKINAETRSNQN